MSGIVAGDSARTRIAYVVVGIWAMAVMVSLVTRDYTALGAVTPVMMIVVGFIFGYRKEGSKNGGG